MTENAWLDLMLLPFMPPPEPPPDDPDWQPQSDGEPDNRRMDEYQIDYIAEKQP